MDRSVLRSPKVMIGAAAAAALVIVAALALAGVGPFAPAAPPPAAPAEPSVQIANYTYKPAQLTVRAGTTVNWTNLDPVEHTVNVDVHGGGHTGAIDSGLLGQGEGFGYKFDTPGTYEYHCHPHPSMVGTITVTA